MFTSAIKFKNRLYDRAVNATLHLYESWILPCPVTYGFQSTKLISLREAKLIEFRERKKLLNPYERPMLLESASQEERIRLEKVAKRTSFENMYTSKLTYDRH